MGIIETVEKIEGMTEKAPVKAVFPNVSEFLNKTAKEVLVILKAWNISSLIFSISYIAYLIYALIANVGNKFVNIGILVFSVAYFTFDLFTKNLKNKANKKQIREAKRWFRYGKIAKDIVKLSLAVYAVVISWNNPTVIGVVLAVFSAITFAAHVLLEVAYTIANRKLNLLKDAVKADFNLFGRVKEKIVENPVVSKVGEAIKGFVSKVKEPALKK